MQSQRIRQQPAETYDSLLGPNQTLEKVEKGNIEN